ncbi:hypothetical protein N7532_001490 [Penicillium argentinense]|uniref:Uncharacterized protein n=1 Tax=Penicillium argentinense TaxID=1131581 RepID=A0A9W9KLU0_9EURO|nr:uncharacterized protein N7532_001490 [Penicillium argentinense]KAJ5110955.1 hypothetical protein N7532_001490 [Penicillium argentinense]
MSLPNNASSSLPEMRRCQTCRQERLAPQFVTNEVTGEASVNCSDCRAEFAKRRAERAERRQKRKETLKMENFSQLYQSISQLKQTMAQVLQSNAQMQQTIAQMRHSLATLADNFQEHEHRYPSVPLARCPRCEKEHSISMFILISGHITGHCLACRLDLGGD